VRVVARREVTGRSAALEESCTRRLLSPRAA
jgi:hypothetical protein